MIFLAVVLYPILEVWLAIHVIREYGFANAFFAWLFTFILGLGLFRTSSLRLTVGVAKAMGEGKSPGLAAVDGAMVSLAGVLFLIPGYISDVGAVLLLIPPVRTAVARMLIRKFQVRTGMGGVSGVYTSGTRTQDQGPVEASSAIIDVDAVVVEDEPANTPQLPKR